MLLCTNAKLALLKEGTWGYRGGSRPEELLCFGRGGGGGKGGRQRIGRGSWEGSFDMLLWQDQTCSLGGGGGGRVCVGVHGDRKGNSMRTR